MHNTQRLPVHPAPFKLLRLRRELVRIGRNAVGHHIVARELSAYADLARASDPRHSRHAHLFRIVLTPQHGYDDPRKLRSDFDGPGLVIVDAAGDIVPPKILIAEAERLACERREARERERAKRFRNGREEGTWRHHPSRRYFRSPETFREIRELQDDDVDGFQVKVRVSRRNLLDAYDDPSFARQPKRNWKSYRKTQWKEPG